VTGRAIAGLAAAAALAVASAAAAQEPVQTLHATLRLLPASEGFGADGRAAVGLEFDLEPGWHIYWRSPGVAGLPPEVSWEGSRNLAAAEMSWPRPTRYELLGIETLAYSERVIFPVTVEARHPSAPMALVADVSFLICGEEICVPDQATVTLNIRPGEGAPTGFTHDIDRFRALVPVPPEQAGLAITGIAIQGEGREGQLLLELAATAPVASADLFPEAGPAWQFGSPQVELAADGLGAAITVPVSTITADVRQLADEPVTLTVVADQRAMEQTLVPAAWTPPAGASAGPRPAAPAGNAAAAGGEGLLAVLGIAVLGGLILNLMPCVLPVLSLKVLSVMGHGGGPRGAVRRSFLASAAGILTSFLVLAAAAILLRSAGVAVGWGMQFQQPVFLAAMLVIVGLFAFSLFGLFEIRLPGAVADVAATAGGPGPARSLRAHFLTGAFATLLATPCTAPFVGTALGFALSRGAAEILAIFLAMGLGLALPYLAIALFPGVATRLPRPGRWMLWVTRLLGVALLATAAWLVSVLASQIGWEAAAGIAMLVALIGAVFAVRRLLPAARIARYAGFAAVGLAAVAVGAALRAPQVARAHDDLSAEAIAWAPFDPAAIPELVASGRTVFVDVTADWCLTCIYNRTAVLERGEVRALLTADSDVVPMLADWTNPDPAIADYLASFGRYGIPFNAVYGPAAPEGVVLPELLTQEAVVEAIAAASGSGITDLAAR
jgi:suppressor for copper-sensitivity B